MKNIIILFLLLLTAQLAHSQTPREFEYKDGDTTYVMKQYFMGFLMRVPDKPELDSAKVAEIQQEHLDYMSANGKSGALLIAGPFGDDGDMRGIVIYDVATKAEADSIISNDPAVKAGRLAIDVKPWWAAKGSVLK
ncbi:MAG: YciI family protein [Reichenbachiella sp.]|uniref:YciI family protein n=1 Tax=Reichenbachiella sp. TaxID=2184521 RepID=UPI003299F16C